VNDITGLTKFTSKTEDDFNKRLLILYVNESYKGYPEMDKYINENINRGLKLHADTWNKWYCRAMGEYWKFLFYNAEFNKSYRDEKYSYKCLKRAYKMGSGDAAAQLGYYYYTGTGITDKPNKKKAAKFFDKAFNQKLFFGEYLYAEAIASDAESKEDLKEALKYYKKAIDKKMILANLKYAYLCIRLDENLDEAIKIFKNAGEYRFSEAIKVCNLLKNSPSIKKYC